MKINELRQFLVDSNLAGYAGGDEKKWVKADDGSTTIVYTKGEWESRDKFFGGEPYGGSIEVKFQDRVVWMMLYYGWVELGIKPDIVYAILREALKNGPEDLPLRGPKEFKQGELTYKNSWKGDLKRYNTEEVVIQGEKIIYKAYTMGGLVDQRTGV